MSHRLISYSFVLITFFSTYSVLGAVNEKFENLYSTFRNSPVAHNAWLLEQPLIGSKDMRTLSDKALIFSLWDMVFESGERDQVEAAMLSLDKLETGILEDSIFVRAVALKNTLGFKLTDKELNRLSDRGQWNEEALMTLETISEKFENLELFSNKMSRRERRRQEFLREASRKDEWQDWQISSLLNFTPKWRRSTRAYERASKLYMFCRHNREYPCLMLMKDPQGSWVRENGKIWYQQKLALSRKGIPSHQVNGHTPQGIYTIDSVMPETNRRIVFGKFRRLILNFIKKDRRDKTMKSLMPEELESLGWWKSGAIARDVGRSLLRIHGTGTKNRNPTSSWYPFYPTVGCIASKENTYDGVA
jgi:hypothetical protein